VKSVLMATDAPFWRRQMGSHQRISSLCRFLLDGGYHLDIAYVGVPDSGDLVLLRNQFPGVSIHPYRTARAPSPLVRRVCRKLYFTGRRIAERMGLFARHRGARCLADYVSGDARDWFQRLYRRASPDAVIIEFVHLGYLVDGLPEGPEHTLLLMDAHDIMSDRHETFRQKGMAAEDWLSITLDEETRILGQFDVVSLIQEDEAQRLRPLLGNSEVITVSHAPDFDWAAGRLVDEARGTTVLFAGGRSPANLDAVRFLLKEVWPSVTNRTGGAAQLILAGAVCDLLVEAEGNLGHGVKLLRRFESEAELYSQVGIVVNPVRVGGGLKIKNVEALCCGKVLLTSTLGAAGIRRGYEEEAFLVCDTAPELIEALVLVTRNGSLRMQLSQKASAFACSAFMPQRAYAELARVLVEAAV
jgi:glycosyltransferase involved in cell wall biosynthesis